MERLKVPFIICDVGSNWKRFESRDDNLQCALQHIRTAARCGVSAVKFQLFTHEELYGIPGDNRWALPREWLGTLRDTAHQHDIQFMCTAFSPEGVMAVDPFVSVHKIASAELLQERIQCTVRGCGKPVIVSTGGASMDEVRAIFNDERYEDDNEVLARNGLIFLECVSDYPAAAADYNLSPMRNWKANWDLQVGISDHTLSPAVALTAIGFGATVFEKHFDACPDMAPTPDTPVSIGPFELREYCALIREGFSAIGDGVKRPRESEREFLKVKRPAGLNTFRGKA